MNFERLMFRRLIAPALVALFIGWGVVAAAGAATLYERSLVKLAERVQGVSPDDYSFVVLGDSRDGDEVFRKILALAQSFKPLFILHSGDVVPVGNEPELNHFLELVRQEAPEMPIFVVVGNHEIGRRGKDLFVEKIAPLHYTLDIPRLDMKVVAVDNARRELEPSELKYLDDQLARGRRFNFLAMHAPPATPRWKEHNFTKGADGLFRVMERRKPTMAFFGHIHLYDEDTVAGVPSFITGGAGAPLRNFGFGDPSYHLLVIRVHNGTATHRVIWLPN